jgi:hypothetical protein
MSTVYRSAVEITPDDNNDLDPMISAVFVGQGGDISLVLTKDSTPVLLKGVSAGTILNLAVKKILATGTTAQFLVGLR